ncbi:MAG TPA: outer membrane beta-barrel protein [bacterium]|jgi:hypothetical protein
MKRSWMIALLLCTLTAGSVWAQSYVVLPTIGIRGGADFARYRDTGSSSGISMKNQTNGTAALTFEHALWHPETYWSTLSLKHDFMYIRTGGRFQMANGAIQKDKVDELRFAPNLLFRWTTHAPAPFIMGGGFVGYDISSKFTTTNAPGGANASGTLQDWNKLNYGVSGGAGFQIPTPAGALSFDGRYNLGLANKFKSGTQNGLKRRTSGVVVMAGLDFRLPGSR